MNSAAHSELAADHPKRKSLQQMSFFTGYVFKQELIHVNLS